MVRSTSQQNFTKSTSQQSSSTVSVPRSSSAKLTRKEDLARSAPQQNSSTVSVPRSSSAKLTRKEDLARSAPQQNSTVSTSLEVLTRYTPREKSRPTSKKNPIRSAPQENSVKSSPWKNCAESSPQSLKGSTGSAPKNFTGSTPQNNSSRSPLQQMDDPVRSAPQKNSVKSTPQMNSIKFPQPLKGSAGSAPKNFTGSTPQNNSSRSPLQQMDDPVRSAPQKNSVKSTPQMNSIKFPQPLKGSAGSAPKNFTGSTSQNNSSGSPVPQMDDPVRSAPQKNSVKSTPQMNSIKFPQPLKGSAGSAPKNFTGSTSQNNSSGSPVPQMDDPVRSAPQKNSVKSTPQMNSIKFPQPLKGSAGSAPKNFTGSTSQNNSSGSPVPQSVTSCTYQRFQRPRSCEEKACDRKNTLCETKNPSQPQKNVRQSGKGGISGQTHTFTDNQANLSSGKIKSPRTCSSGAISERLEELSRPIRRVRSTPEKTTARQSRKRRRRSPRKKVNQPEERGDAPSTPQLLTELPSKKMNGRTSKRGIPQSHASSCADRQGNHLGEPKSSWSVNGAGTLSKLRSSPLLSVRKTRSQVPNSPQADNQNMCCTIARRKVTEVAVTSTQCSLARYSSTAAEGKNTEKGSNAVLEFVHYKKRSGKKKRNKAKRTVVLKKKEEEEQPQENKLSAKKMPRNESLTKMLPRGKNRTKNEQVSKDKTRTLSVNEETNILPLIGQQVLPEEERQKVRTSHFCRVMSATDSECNTRAPCSSPMSYTSNMPQKRIIISDDDLDCNYNDILEKDMHEGLISTVHSSVDRFLNREIAFTPEPVEGIHAMETSAQAREVDPTLELLEEMDSYFENIMRRKGHYEDTLASAVRLSEQEEEANENESSSVEWCDQWKNGKAEGKFYDEEVHKLFPEASCPDTELSEALRKINDDRFGSDREVVQLFPVARRVGQGDVSRSTSSTSSTSTCNSTHWNAVQVRRNGWIQEIVRDRSRSDLDMFTHTVPSGASDFVSHSQEVAPSISPSSAGYSPRTRHVRCPGFVSSQDTERSSSSFLDCGCAVHSAGDVLSDSPGLMWQPGRGCHDTFRHGCTLSAWKNLTKDAASLDTVSRQRLVIPERSQTSLQGVFPCVTSAEDSSRASCKCCDQNAWDRPRDASTPRKHASSKANSVRPRSAPHSLAEDSERGFVIVGRHIDL